ncbi:hypothetical protein SD77_1635 [Bacillus badius]|uniref:Mobile element protein n=1 Tax=Bacillus badius TaxID=1455 RepID=A0ABR5AR05_BACBA|nr:hypothetical protein SD78_2886 [Bacillus badius]KIL77188.1 hypothetical protein SD77_1635 [Bacillus badius]
MFRLASFSLMKKEYMLLRIFMNRSDIDQSLEFIRTICLIDCSN